MYNNVMLFQFIGAMIGTGVMVSLASLVWPKITNQPRPELLTRVHDVVVETPLGKNIEGVLGEQTVNMSEIVSSAANTAVTSVTKSAKQSVILKMFESLSEDEQEEFRAQICTP